MQSPTKIKADHSLGTGTPLKRPSKEPSFTSPKHSRKSSIIERKSSQTSDSQSNLGSRHGEGDDMVGDLPGTQMLGQGKSKSDQFGGASKQKLSYVNKNARQSVIDLKLKKQQIAASFGAASDKGDGTPSKIKRASQAHDDKRMSGIDIGEL